MDCGILINMPHWAVKHKIIPLIFIEKNHHASWQICNDFTEFTECILKYQRYKQVWICNLYIRTTTAWFKLKRYGKFAGHSITTKSTNNWWYLPGLNGPKLLLYIKFPWFITAGSPLQDESKKKIKVTLYPNVLLNGNNSTMIVFINIGVIPAEHNDYICNMFLVRSHLNLCFGTHTIKERSISSSNIKHCHPF